MEQIIRADFINAVRDVMIAALNSSLLGVVVGAGLGLAIARSESATERAKRNIRDLEGLFTEVIANAVYCERVKEEDRYPVMILSVGVLEEVYVRCFAMDLVDATTPILSYRTMLLILNAEIQRCIGKMSIPVAEVDTALDVHRQEDVVRKQIAAFHENFPRVLAALEREIKKRNPKTKISIPPHMQLKAA